MTALVLCDGFKVMQVALLAVKYHCGIEIQSFYQPDILAREPELLDIHKKAIAGIGIRSMHGPFADLCPGSVDVMVRDVARKRYNQAADVCKQLDVSHIILHHGYVPGTSSPGGWLSRCVPFWQSYLDSIPDSLTVHLENILDHDPGLLLELVNSVARTNFDICLDIGHAHCLSKQTVLDWIKKLGRRIGHVHIHDNSGIADEHLGLGRGTIPIMQVCLALKEYTPEAIWALETPHLEESIFWLQEREFVS